MARDLSRARAILIGNGSFENPRIGALPATGCVTAVTELLVGPLCGWPAERITALDNMATPDRLARSVIAAVRDARDVLLVYYVGHGFRTRTGQLALALYETDLDPEALPYTAMLYANLADILRGCQAATKLVILDCCHAELGGKASDLFQGADLADAYPVDGLYFIGSSKRDEGAKYPEDGKLTYFTQALIEVVQGGIPGQPEDLRLDQIFLELRARLVKARLPEPVDAGIRGARQYPFARNAAWPARPILLPEHAGHHQPPGDREAGQAQQDARLASRYQQGRRAEQEQDWTSAVAHYEAISAAEPSYRDVAVRLGESVRLRNVAALQEQLREMFADGEFHAVVGIAERLAELDLSAADPDGLTTQARQLLASQGSRDAGPQRALQDAINEADRQLDDIWAARTTFTTAIPGRTPAADSQDSPGPAPQQPQQADQRPPARPAAQPDPPPARATLQSPSDRPAAATAPAAGKKPQPARPDSESGVLGPEPATPTAGTSTPRSTPDAVIARQHVHSEPDSRNSRVHPTRHLRRRFFATALASAALVAAVVVPLVLAAPDAPPISGPLTGTLTSTLTDPKASNATPGINSVAFSPAGAILAAGDNTGSAYLWNVATRKITTTLTPPGANIVGSVVFSLDGTTLAATDVEGHSYLWNLASRKITTTISIPGIGSVVFSPDRTTLAVINNFGWVYLWNLASRKITGTFTDPGHHDEVPNINSVAFSPDGTTLAVGEQDGSTYLWNVGTRKITATLTDPGAHGVDSVAFSPAGNTLAFGDQDGSTYLWNIATRKISTALTDPGKGNQVSLVAFSPDGTTLATTDGRNRTYLWYLPTRERTDSLIDPSSNSNVSSLAFSPDGNTLAVGDQDGSAYLWTLTGHAS